MQNKHFVVAKRRRVRYVTDFDDARSHRVATGRIAAGCAARRPMRTRRVDIRRDGESAHEGRRIGTRLRSDDGAPTAMTKITSPRTAYRLKKLSSPRRRGELEGFGKHANRRVEFLKAPGARWTSSRMAIAITRPLPYKSEDRCVTR